MIDFEAYTTGIAIAVTTGVFTLFAAWVRGCRKCQSLSQENARLKAALHQMDTAMSGVRAEMENKNRRAG